MSAIKDATNNSRDIVTSALPDMYAQAPEGELHTLRCVQTYQATHECLCCNQFVTLLLKSTQTCY